MNYSTLYTEHQQLLELANGDQDTYWKAQEAFKKTLQTALRDDKLMMGLNGLQLIRFLSWCSSHRPYEPHVILTIFSQLANKINKNG